MVKHLPAMQETWVRSLGWEDPWRRKWQPTPLLLPRKFHGWRSLVGNMGSQRVRHDWTTSLSLWAVKNLPANVGDIGDGGSVPGFGRSPGIGNGNPLWYSCLGNLLDRETWWAIVHGVAKSWTWLNGSAHKDLLCLWHPARFWRKKFSKKGTKEGRKQTRIVINVLKTMSRGILGTQ